MQNASMIARLPKSTLGLFLSRKVVSLSSLPCLGKESYQMASKTLFRIKSLRSILYLGILILSSFSFNSRIANLPNTGVSVLSRLSSFSKTDHKILNSGGSGNAIQVSVSGKFSYQVVQSGNSAPSGYVVGQYSVAAKRGNIGFLAHNYAAGSSFYALSFGDEVVVTFSDGSTKTFTVNNVLRYQASTPGDFSSFIDSKGNTVKAQTVFNRAYKRNQVTFQTCIARDGSDSWGLLFVQAAPKK